MPAKPNGANPPTPQRSDVPHVVSLPSEFIQVVFCFKSKIDKINSLKVKLENNSIDNYVNLQTPIAYVAFCCARHEDERDHEYVQKGQNRVHKR